ncbi:hypothetical protein ACSQ67_019043 [Phaseolus vulgaris]
MNSPGVNKTTPTSSTRKVPQPLASFYIRLVLQRTLHTRPIPRPQHLALFQLCLLSSKSQEHVYKPPLHTKLRHTLFQAETDHAGHTIFSTFTYVFLYPRQIKRPLNNHQSTYDEDFSLYTTKRTYVLTPSTSPLNHPYDIYYFGNCEKIPSGAIIGNIDMACEWKHLQCHSWRNVTPRLGPWLGLQALCSSLHGLFKSISAGFPVEEVSFEEKFRSFGG